MQILRFFLRSAGALTLVLGALSASSGLLNAGLVALVHQVLTQGASQPLLAAFLGIATAKVVTGYFSGVLLMRYSHRSVARLRMELIERFLVVPYARFEQLGRQRVFAALTEDVATANAALQAVPGMIVNVAVVCGGSAYLLYLSAPTFFAVALLFALGSLVYRAISRDARSYLVRARDEHDQLFGHFRALTDGTKELKQHAQRRDAFLEQSVRETTERLMQQYVSGHTRFVLGQASSSLVSVLALALILFVMPSVVSLSSATISGYVLTCLYLMGPLSAAIRMLPLYTSADVALRRIGELGVALGALGQEGRAPAVAQRFERIELASVEHVYTEERGAAGFALGPVSFAIQPGEVIFLTGNNGSGKSTLAKILVGLYEPERGQVLWDGAVVSDATRDAYRQLFSVIFSDYYLFDSLLGLPGADLEARAEQLLQRLQLTGQVWLTQGRRLSSLQLSHGQRKRLALLTAYLEDRPVYVFDEWAADQDPEFKEIFYRELIPELRARGKAVIVVTHDDRYFALADRRLSLAAGKLVELGAPTAGATASPRQPGASAAQPRRTSTET